MRTLNGIFGAVALVGAVCCAAVAMLTPVSWAWAGWTVAAVFCAHRAGGTLGAAVFGDE